MTNIVLKSHIGDGASVQPWVQKLLGEGQLGFFPAVKAKHRKFAAEKLLEGGAKLHDTMSVSFDTAGRICVEFPDEKTRTLFLLKYS